MSIKKKILLVRMPEIEYKSDNFDMRSNSAAGLSVPLGVTYLASVIRNYPDKYEVKILDLYGEFYDFFKANVNDDEKVFNFSYEKICQLIKEYKPEIVGISAIFAFQHYLVRDIVKAVKEKFSNIKIYIGGYTTIAPEIVLKEISLVDGVFIGESEKTIIEVLEAGDNQDALSKINGFGYRLDDIFFINKNLNLVVDVDEIPYPAYDLLPLNKYKEFMGKNIFSILTSRSCPFACSFCSGYLYSGRGQRRRNIDKVIEEIEWLKYQYGAEFLWIRDENFNVNKNHAKGLLKEMIDKKINIPWLDTNGFHVNSVDEEFLDLVKSSDCNEIIFAVESGSERVLKEIMKKNVNLEHAKKMAEHCRKIGLVVQCYFVIGNPGETKEEIMQTIELAKEMKVDHCTFSLATPFPGTEYYDIAVKKKYLVHDTNYILSMKYMEANMETENFTPEWLKDTQYDANIRVNFLENKNLYFSKETQEKSLEYYGRVYQQYNFHAIAHLIEGYLEGKQGNYSRQNFIFNEVREALKEENISKAYAKYIYWNTAPTNCYRQWLELQNI